MSFANQIAQLFKGRPDTRGVVYTRYPAEAAGVTLTGSAATTGAYEYAAAAAGEVQVIAANLITTRFWVAGVALATPSNPVVFVVSVMSGLITAGVRLFEAQFGEFIATGITGFTQFVPIPPKLPPNTAVCADMACGGAADDTADCAVIIRT